MGSEKNQETAHEGLCGPLVGLGVLNVKEIENFWDFIFILKCLLWQLY